jgi:hypothetical protein
MKTYKNGEGVEAIDRMEGVWPSYIILPGESEANISLRKPRGTGWNDLGSDKGWLWANVNKVMNHRVP